jgi:uncharacterized membrane protein (DUF106 family)
MHFVSLVPLSLGILFVVVVAMAKAAALLIIAVIGLVVWLIYELFFKKEEVEEEERDPEAEFWEKMLEDQERGNEEFYKEIGRLEQKLDDLEESAGITKKRRK